MNAWAKAMAPVLAALAWMLAPAAHADQRAERATMAQTFVVQSVINEHTGVIGTGVVVRREGDVLTLVTAAHVIRDGAPMRILDTSRRAYYDVIDIRTLPQYDLAFIHVRAQGDFTVQPVDFGTPVPGQPVWIWGNPPNSFWRLATGVVRSTSVQLPGEHGGSRFTIDCHECSPGDSGSGVFTGDGKLLGIVLAGWEKKNGGPVLFVEVLPVDAIARELTSSEHIAQTDPGVPEASPIPHRSF